MQEPITDPIEEPQATDQNLDPQIEGAEPTGDATVDPETTDFGKTKRAEQELAKYRRVMEVLGIDPESDIADRVAQGLISKEEVLGHNVPRPAVRETPMERLTKLTQKIEHGHPTEGDFREAMKIISEFVSEQSVREQNAQMQAVVDSCRNAVVGVLAADKMHSEMPDDVRALEEQMFIASTDNLLTQEASKLPDPRRYFNPQAYQFFAQKNAQSLKALRDYYINQGRAMERQALTRPPQNPNVSPVSPNVGDGPVTIPQPRLKMGADLTRAAKTYLQQAQVRV